MTQERLIDPAVLEQYCGHDASIQQEILSVFTDSFAQDIWQLQQAIQTQNLEETRFLLHRMKGPLQVIGSHRTLKAIDECRQQLDQGNYLMEDMQRLLAQFQRVLEAVRALLTSHSPPSPFL